MKRLGLLRHAKSDSDDLSLRDFDRGLNERGRRGAAVMGEHIGLHGVPWDVLLASPAERVRRTIEATRLQVPVTWNEHLYLADSDTLLQVLRAVAGDPAAVLLAGHNPGLQELIFELVPPEHDSALLSTAADKFPTAAFAVLELAIERWADSVPGCGVLVHLARPRDLDPELGPQSIR